MAPTDIDWFNRLRDSSYDGEVNFWTPTPWNLTRLTAGDRFYFMLKSPIRKIGGYGVFARYENMSPSKAWEVFGEGNGVENEEVFLRRLQRYVEKNSASGYQGDEQPIGCIALRDPVFLEDADFYSPEDVGLEFAPTIVKAKYFDTDPGLPTEGREMGVEEHQVENLRPKKVWWVNQGQTYQEERDGNYIWAPLRDKSDREHKHHCRLADCIPGDIVVNYSRGHIRAVSTVVEHAVTAERPSELPSDAWATQGRSVTLRYLDLDEPIALNEIPLTLRSDEQMRNPDSPFDKVGQIKQGYLYSISDDAASRLASELSERWPAGIEWPEFRDNKNVERVWCVYVGARAAVNFKIALANNIWGSNESPGEIRQGDRVIFVHSIQSDLLPPPSGYPRVSDAEDFSGVAGEIVEGVVLSDLVEDRAALWPNDIYPHRFPFQKSTEKQNVPFDTSNYLEPIVDAVRLSACQRGLPKLAIVERTMEPTPIRPQAEPFGIDDALEGLFVSRDFVEEAIQLWQSKRNMVLQGPPGAGKTFLAKRLAYLLMKEKASSRTQMVQFHQSYSYEDFIQGYRPKDGAFVRKNGVFFNFCEQARRDLGNDYVFVIDEINRGNLSKVFGETLMLIEGDKRDNEWALQLTYSETSDPPFFVPPNVYLLGMMNTADRSLALVDYALRRRFAFVDVGSQISSDSFRNHLQKIGVEEGVINLIRDRIGQLNTLIADDRVNLGPGFCVGHSYFCPQSAAGAFDHTWYDRIVRSEIAPLIREYWFDNPDRAKDEIDKLRTA